jgi:hypothetical protein
MLGEPSCETQLCSLAYAMEHSSKPQTLAYGLNDSPAGLAAWIIEKFWCWSDNDGDVEGRARLPCIAEKSDQYPLRLVRPCTPAGVRPGSTQITAPLGSGNEAVQASTRCW